jgi:hypothetical protein
MVRSTIGSDHLQRHMSGEGVHRKGHHEEDAAGIQKNSDFHGHWRIAGGGVAAPDGCADLRASVWRLARWKDEVPLREARQVPARASRLPPHTIPRYRGSSSTFTRILMVKIVMELSTR